VPAEERKLATILFADLVGSTELAGGQDPERVRALLDRFYDAMAAEVERAGGTVEKFAGDAVMAVFGRRWRMRMTRSGLCMWRWGCSGGWGSCSAAGWRFASA
jgi:class 3 adenylate cyclase